MKLRDIVRKDKKNVKMELRHAKKKNNPPPDEWLHIRPDGDGDNAVRSLNDTQGPI